MRTKSGNEACALIRLRLTVRIAVREDCVDRSDGVAKGSLVCLTCDRIRFAIPEAPRCVVQTLASLFRNHDVHDESERALLSGR